MTRNRKSRKPPEDRDVHEAAAAIGCELGAIVKSLCFLVDGRPLLVLAAGDRRVDTKVLRRILESFGSRPTLP